MPINLNVGIVGFGGAGIAQFGHFQSMRDCRVTAVYDSKPGGVDRARSIAPGILATDDFQKFIASGINSVAICSSDASHAEYVIAAINAGLHVVCEKPLTDSPESCQQILRAEASAPGVVVAVQHQMRFLPVHLEIKKLIQSGRLGRIGYIEGYYVHNLTERGSLYDDWRFTDNATPLIYSGCHFIDLFRWLLDDEVEEIMGMANNILFPQYPESDLNVLLCRFRSGVIAKLVVAFGAGRPQDHSVRVYGSDMSIENNLLFSKSGDFTVFARPDLPIRPPSPAPTHQQPFYSLRGRGYVWRARSAAAWLKASWPSYRTHYIGSAMEWLMKRNGPQVEYGIAAYPIRLYPHMLAVRASLENFAAAVRGEQELLCTAREAARTVVTCCAGVEAYRTGKTIKVADFWVPELG